MPTPLNRIEICGSPTPDSRLRFDCHQLPDTSPSEIQQFNFRILWRHRVMWREERKRSCESTPLELHSSSFEYPASSRRYTRRRYDSIDCSIRLTWWRGILFNLQLLRLPFVGRHGGHMYISTRQLHIVEDLNQLARTQLYLYSYVFSYYYYTSSK